MGGFATLLSLRSPFFGPEQLDCFAREERSLVLTALVRYDGDASH
jgi:hypothetical protein